MDTGFAWNRRLLCRWSAIEVSGPKSLRIRLQEGETTDMRGATSVAEFLMPSVQEVSIICGDRPDAVYRRDKGSDWHAFIPLRFGRG